MHGCHAKLKNLPRICQWKQKDVNAMDKEGLNIDTAMETCSLIRMTFIQSFGVKSPTSSENTAARRVKELKAGN